LKEWFTNPANGIGTLTGQGGIDWIDLDRKNFETQADCDNARAMILEKCDRTYFESTKSGGAHIAVKLAQPKAFTNFQIGSEGQHAGEFLGHGRFVVLSPTPGYVALNGDEIACVESAEALGIVPTGNKPESTEAAEIDEANKNFDMDKPPVAIELLISKKCKDILQGSKVEDVSKAITTLARELYAVAEWYPAQALPVTGNAETLLRVAAEKLGVDSDRLSRILESVPQYGNIPSLVKFGGVNKAIAFFRKQRKSTVKGDEVCAELRKIRDLRAYYEGRLAFNQLSQKIEIDGVAVEDIEGERVVYVESTNKTIGVDVFCTVVRVIANENSYHPVAVYLEGVAGEHGEDTSILDNIAKRYFGVSDDLYDIYVKRWLISAVARVFDPGCKADCALFLQGGQGAGKSTFFSNLAGKDFFSDSLGDANSNKDEILLMHRFWLHEWSELESVFRKKEMATVKSFMARRFDSVRPPYRRDLVDLKRSCVFCGTTNEGNFLSDSTGDRRFWIIPVNGEIPVGLMESERDKIWAAAVALYRAGEQWHLLKSEEAQSRELNAQFRSLDPWHEKIAMFIGGRDCVSTNEILNECFEIELKSIGKREQLRVSSVMTALGWQQKVKTIAGKSVRKWVPPVRVVEPVQVFEPVAAVGTTQPIEPVQAFDPDLKVGDKVIYIGVRQPELQGIEFTVYSIKDDEAVCMKPDGSLERNLLIDELMPEES
jgi:predicted P-loop ATPase